MDDKELLEQIQDLIDIQCVKGTVDYDQYMRGLCNGLLIARSVVDGAEPEFIKAPDRWLSDIAILEKFNKSGIVLHHD